MNAGKTFLPPSVPALVRASAQRLAGAEALVEDGVRTNFAELSCQVDTAARAAVAAGLGPGERAAIWAPNSSQWAVAALGVLAAGGVLVPVNTRFKGSEARYVLERSGARLLFTVRGFLGNDYPAMLTEACRDEPLTALRKTVVFEAERDAQVGREAMGEPHPTHPTHPTYPTEEPFRAFLEGGVLVDPAEIDRRIAAISPDTVSDVIFTSGTTGHPKGVMASHAQTLRVFHTWSETVGLEAGDRYLVVNPFFHTFGYKAGLIACLLAGATVVPMATLDVPALMATVESERITVLPGPPTLYATILDHPERSKYDLSSLRLAVTGAAVVPVELILRMRDELAFETVLTAYGLTEATGTVTMCRRGDDAGIIASTSGRAIPGTEVRIVDDAGAPLPAGQPGEVVVRGYNVMAGYFEDPEQTAATIDADGWLHTGDIGVMDEAGNLTITDRKKDMFIVGGFNAYPAEIEKMLMGHAAVSQVAVIGVPDERMGEVGMAFVVLRAGAEVDPDGLMTWARDRMANYKVPRHVRVVDALPLNASGKVVKGDLRDLARLPAG